MDHRTLPLLSCIARRMHKGQTKSPRETQVCDGGLVQRDSLTLLCSNCGVEYPIKSGIPQLILDRTHNNPYADDQTIRKYYEMHFGKRLSGADVNRRLSFPQPNLVSASREHPQIELFKSTCPQRQPCSEKQDDFYQSLRSLVADSHLTEEFYVYICGLIQPLLANGSVVLDIGCGLGRMTAEMAALGAAHVIGVDFSPRMIEEAAKIINAKGSIPISLDLVAGRSISAQLESECPVRNVDFLVGDAERLPFKTATFDFALALNILDRIPNPELGIKEAGRILKRGAHLVINNPYDWNEGPAKREKWVADLNVLFDESLWRREREIDGIPFVMRGSSRRITIYLTHCLIYQRT